MSVPPMNVNPTTTVDLEDSCNCCWGGKARKSKRHNREFSRDLENPARTRDVNEVYNLNVNVNVDSPQQPRRSSHHSREHHSHDQDKKTRRHSDDHKSHKHHKSNKKEGKK